MKTTVSSYDFHRAFEELRPENFTHVGLEVLFDYFEEYEACTGEEIELDVIAICCEYDEDTVDGIASNYNIDLSECEDDEEKRETVLDYLNDNTIVCGESTDGFVYARF